MATTIKNDKTIENFQAFETLNKTGKPVLLDFYADWCGPCQSLLPIVNKLSEKYEDDFLIRKVNVEKFPQLAEQFGVRSIPHYLS